MHVAEIINDSISSLDVWLNYLMSPDSDYLPPLGLKCGLLWAY